MKKIFWLFISLVSLFSCQKVIDVDLNESSAKIVVEANFTAEDSTVTVMVSQTGSYFSGSANPVVNNASVQIVDQTGTISIVPLIGNGKYVLKNYVPQFNTTYTMNVVVDGVTYTSSCLLPTVVPQENITYQFLPDGFFGSDPGYLVFWRFNDPVVEGDCYMAVVTENDTVKNKVFDFVLQDDKFSNGNLTERPLFGKFYQLNDTLEIEMRTIAPNVLSYYSELQSLGDGANSAAPANPTYFWTNKALGYFSCYGVSRKTVIIN